MVSNTRTLANLFIYLFFETAGSPDNPSRKVVGDAIIFNSVQIGTSAVYQCNASNEHGYLLANAFVNILGERSVQVIGYCIEFSVSVVEQSIFMLDFAIKV